MATETLNPVDISQLAWLTGKQACIYLNMSHPKFSDLVQRQKIPFQSDHPSQPNAKRRFYRRLLDKAMLDDMQDQSSKALSKAAAERVATIMGDIQ